MIGGDLCEEEAEVSHDTLEGGQVGGRDTAQYSVNMQYLCQG